MRKKLLIGLGVLAGLILIFVLVVVFQPNQFQVQRSMTMAAPAADAFKQVNNLHRWDAWSPWAHIDPNMKQTYEGPEEGVGASYTWSGNDEVGEGRMTIIESRPHELVKLKLEFFRPFESTSTSQFAFEPAGEQTKVTWSMSGENNFVSKAVQLFMNMDQMLGGQFEEGLTKMKATVEKAAVDQANDEKPLPAHSPAPDITLPGDNANPQDRRLQLNNQVQPSLTILTLIGNATRYEVATHVRVRGKLAKYRGATDDGRSSIGRHAQGSLHSHR